MCGCLTIATRKSLYHHRSVRMPRKALALVRGFFVGCVRGAYRAAARRNAHFWRQLFPNVAALKSVEKMFAEHVMKYNKVYASEAEYYHRQNVFTNNLAFIEMYNRDKSPMTGITCMYLLSASLAVIVGS